jgi:hypothetical protein
MASRQEALVEDLVTAEPIPIPGGRFSMWRSVCMRSAGFPVDWALALAGPDAQRALREMASDPRFREAIAWQNRAFLSGSLASLLRSTKRGSNARRHERAVARYIQRYSTKCDSIGFFGPIAWGRISDDGPHVRAVPGPEITGARHVHFEHWAIDALARSLSRDPSLEPWLTARRSPAIHADAGRLELPSGKSLRLGEWEASILARCDGRIARDVGEPWERVRRALQRFAEQGAITLRLEVPTERIDPEDALRTAIDRIGDPSVRESTQAALDRLDQKRRVLAASAGDATAADRAFADLEATFVEMTGEPPRRRAGETYAGRTIAYEDCRRDVDLSIGTNIIETIGPALSLVLESARWFTFEIARRVEAKLLAEAPGTEVSFAAFWSAASKRLDPSAIAGDVVIELGRRWSSIVAPASEKRVTRSAAEMRAQVEHAFRAPTSGWPMARFQSPDLLIAARGADAWNRGDYYAVLGELHAGVAGQLLPFLVAEHPRPDELIAHHRRELGRPSIAPVIAKERYHRAEHYSLAPDDLHLVTSEPSWRERERAIPIGDLMLTRTGDRLSVRTRDRHLELPIIDVLERLLIGAGLNRFRLLPLDEHAPRVTIDRLVVSRERWRLDTREILSNRHWPATYGVPRFLFYKTEAEPKPCYLDVESEVLMDLFRRSAAESDEVVISEMLPGHDETWLTDAQGRRYVSELRLVCTEGR